MGVRKVEILITGTNAQLNKALRDSGLIAEEEANHIGNKFDAASTRVGNSFQRLGASLSNWGVPFAGSISKVGDKFDEANTRGQKFGQAMSTLGGATLAAGVVGITAFGVESVKAAANFQSAMEMIHTQAGASQAEVEKMKGAVLDLAGPTATAPMELAGALYHIESTGVRGAKALSELKISAEGAKVGHANLEDVTNALNASIASGIPGVQNMGQAMGALNAIVGAGDMHMQDLSEALGTGVLAVVKGYGLSLNDVGAALATFGDNNIRGADAATKLRTAVQAMSVPAGTAKKALGEIGMTTTQLATDLQHGGLNQAITDLHDHLEASGKAGAESGQILTEAFGKKAGPGIQILTDQFTRFQSKVKEVNDGASGFGSDWQATTQTLSFQMDQAKATAEALAVKFGTFLIPKLEELMKAISGVVTWFEKHKAAAIALAVVIGGVLSAAIAVFTVNKISSMINSVKMAAQTLGLFGTSATEMAATTEVAATETDAAIGSTGIGAVLIALGIAVVLLMTHWKQVWGFIKDAVRDAFDFIKAHWDILVGVFFGPIGLAIAELVKHWGEVWGTIKSVLGDAWGVIKGIFDAFISAIDKVKNAIHDVLGAIGKVGSGINSVIHAGGGFNPLNWDTGGPVPGAVGQPVFGTVHGGEFVLSHDMVMGRDTSWLSQVPGAASAAAGASHRGGDHYEVNVTAHTNANGSDIANEIGWQFRTMR